MNHFPLRVLPLVEDCTGLRVDHCNHDAANSDGVASSCARPVRFVHPEGPITQLPQLQGEGVSLSVVCFNLGHAEDVRLGVLLPEVGDSNRRIEVAVNVDIVQPEILW